MAALVRSEREQVGVAETLADRCRLPGDCCGRFQIAAPHVPEDERQQQVARLGAVAAFVLEKPIGAAEPAARAPELAALCEIHPDPERARSAARPSPAARRASYARSSRAKTPLPVRA